MVTSYSQVPQTSSAVNIQIIEPKNFPGGASPGQVQSAAGPGPMGSAVTSAGNQYPVQNNPYASPGMGGAYPANYNNMFPAANAQQQLQNAYSQALTARNNAEQARNQYLNLANQLNNQAYQQQAFSQQLPYYQQNPAQPYSPYGQQQGYGQQFPMPYPGMNPMAYQQPFQQPYQQQPFNQPQQPPVQPEPQQPQQPEQTPPPVTEPTVQTASVDELNRMIDQPATLQERVDAMEEIGVRGKGTPTTYELLKREALADTSNLQGQAKDDAEYVRQAALWTLGMLNANQNGNVPTANMPGIDVIEQIVKDKNENPQVKQAAIQALQVINRPKDKRVKKILKTATGNTGLLSKLPFIGPKVDPDVKRMAQQALNGQTIPLPNAQ